MYDAEIQSIESQMKARVEMLEAKQQIINNDPLWSIESLFENNPELSIEKFDMALADKIKRFSRMIKSTEDFETSEKEEIGWEDPYPFLSDLHDKRLEFKKQQKPSFKECMGRILLSITAFIVKVIDFIIMAIFKLVSSLSIKIKELINGDINKSLLARPEILSLAKEFFYNSYIIYNDKFLKDFRFGNPTLPLASIDFTKCIEYFKQEMKLHKYMHEHAIDMINTGGKYINGQGLFDDAKMHSTYSDLKNTILHEYKLKEEFYYSPSARDNYKEYFAILKLNDKNGTTENTTSDVESELYHEEDITTLGSYKIVPISYLKNNFIPKHSDVVWFDAIDYFIHTKLYKPNELRDSVNDLLVKERLTGVDIFGEGSFDTNTYISNLKSFIKKLDDFKKSFNEYKNEMKKLYNDAVSIEKNMLSNSSMNNDIKTIITYLRSSTSDLEVFQKLILYLNRSVSLKNYTYEKVKSESISRASEEGTSQFNPGNVIEITL